jgi:predicted small lipoprotein YifL
MRTIRLQYLQKKLHQKSTFKPLLLTFIATLFLSACGIKGDLYQTPAQPVTEKETTEIDVDKAQDDSQKSLKPEKEPIVQQPIKQVSEQQTDLELKPALEQAIEPATDPVKSPNNVS